MSKDKQLDFSGQDIFVGLDTHLKSWQVSIMVGATFYKTYSQDPNSETLRNYGSSLYLVGYYGKGN